MLRTALLYLSRQPALRQLATEQPVVRSLARRFVAGETIDDAISAIRSLNDAGLIASIDYLGENVDQPEKTKQAVAVYRAAIERIAALGLRSSCSLKLTQLGLDLDKDLCVANLTEILEAAATHGIFIRVDMESSAYAERTLEIVSRLHRRYEHLGAVIQACLYRSRDDVRRMNEEGIGVRLCKGAYQEPPAVAYQNKVEVDRNYRRLAESLLLRGTYPAIATHDERILGWVTGFTDELSIPPDRFEFQLLYGIRRDLQSRLVRLGYCVRIYVPFGGEWYPYLVRRLAERTANLAFVISSVLHEARNGRSGGRTGGQRDRATG